MLGPLALAPHRPHDDPRRLPPQNPDLGQHAAPTGLAPHVQHQLHTRGQLTVQALPGQSAERGQALQPSGRLGRRIGVQRARAAVVAGVQGGQELALSPNKTMTTEIVGSHDIVFALVAAVFAFVVTVAAWFAHRLVVRIVKRARRVTRMAVWRRRYNRWAAKQHSPVASADLVAVVSKLIADGAR